MITSFSTALSALNASSTAIDVVANNLANLNTTGYKENVLSFHDLVSQSLGGVGETQVGFGIARPLTSRQFAQGATPASSGQLDAAIEGDGFFVVNDPATNATLYTRAGDFQIDKSGSLLTSTGQNVQGWTIANGVLNTSGAVANIKIPVGQFGQPVATSKFSMSANLNASAAVNDNFSTPIQVIDSLGNPLILTASFTKTAPLTWTYQITIPGDATTSGTPGTPTALLTTPVTLTFGGDGKPDATTMTALATPTPVSIPGLTDRAAPLSINFSLLAADGTSTITQYAQPSAQSANSPDGISAAQLTSIGLANDGQVLAQYSNGTFQVVAQVALAAIINPGSLIAVGRNNYQSSAATAKAAVGMPSTGGRGDIKTGALESSTVDIAKEFTNLIVFQRAYQANGKVITTSDQISQDTINLIR